jgi:hypothetical protein
VSGWRVEVGEGGWEVKGRREEVGRVLCNKFLFVSNRSHLSFLFNKILSSSAFD